ncbi:MAG: hypothetical protein IKD05_04165, partial [Tidjanibacter sp.]|nr:hypothetical protein [Tidjanibacter sp.]
ENELYSLFGNKYTFLSILQDSQFQKTNVQVVDKAYKLAFKEIGMHADRIVSYAEQLLNSGQPDGSKNISLSTPMGAADLKKLSLKLSDFAIDL